MFVSKEFITLAQRHSDLVDRDVRLEQATLVDGTVAIWAYGRYEYPLGDATEGHYVTFFQHDKGKVELFDGKLYVVTGDATVMEFHQWRQG